MLAIFFALVNAQFNLLTINGEPASSFAGKGRPVFLRMVITGCPFAPPSVEQWEQASRLFPQVDFVTYDCWKDNGQGVCQQFLEGSSSPFHVLIHSDKLVAYPDGFGNPPDISKTPQRFINTIIANTGLYPILPPIFPLYPQNTDQFVNSSKNPIFLIYDSTRSDHSPFVSAWTKAANEELYPEDDSISFGILDSSKYPNECMRWTQSEKLESPIAVVYSRKTGQFTKIQSYFSVVSDVKTSILNINLITDLKELPKQVQEDGISEKNPTPTPVSSDYKIIRNDNLQERSMSSIKSEYLKVFNFDGPSYSGQPADDKTCNDVQPSESDHKAALGVLNFLRKLAGLSDTVVEDSEWSSDCQDTALIIHKIGLVPSDHIVRPILIPKTCTQSNEFIQNVVETAAVSNLASNDESCYESIYKFILDDGVHNRFLVGHRRSLFHPNLQKIGMGYYPQVNEPTGSPNVFNQMPAVTVVRALNRKETQDTEYLPKDINFVSWPSAGPFPIDELPTTWTISYKGFRKDNLKSINDLQIYITRDDGTLIPFDAQLSRDEGSATQDTLSLYIPPESFGLCQIMRTISVQIVNDEQKYSLEFSFTLFGKNSQTDICLYATDDSKCPSDVPDNLRFQQDNLADNENAKSILCGNENVLVSVAQDISIGNDALMILAPIVFLKGSKIIGTIEISVSSIVNIQDPSKTNFIIDWNPMSEKIGYLSTAGTPLSVLVKETDKNESIVYQNLEFYNGNVTNLNFDEQVIHFREIDVFNSFNYINGEYYVNAYALKSIAEYSVGYEKYYEAPNSILVRTNSDMEKQHTYRKKVKIYTPEEKINYTIFMEGQKKDYIIIAPKIGQKYYFFCAKEAENRVNSLTIEPDPLNKKYSSIVEFDLSQVNDIRKKCNIPNVVINGVPYSGYYDSNSNAFTNIQGDINAVNFYSEGAKRNLIIRPKPTTNENFPGKHILNIVFDKSKYGSPSSNGYNPIIYTPGDFSEYTIIQPYEERNNYKYNTYEFRPEPGSEDKPVMLTFYREVADWEFAPQYYTDFQGIWFTGYKNITIHFNSNPLKRVDGKWVPSDAMDKYHFDSCQYVTFIGTKDIPAPDPGNLPQYIMDTPIEIKQDQPVFTFSNGNPYQIIIPTSVIFSATTIFEAKNIDTPIVTVKASTYSTIKEMRITQSIAVDSGSITLDNCKLSDGISISMKKDLNWPHISLIDTSFNPESIEIVVGSTASSSAVLLEELTDTLPHVVVDGIQDGKCEELNSKVNLINDGKYKHYCLGGNQIVVSQLDESNFATPEPPTPTPPPATPEPPTPTPPPATPEPPTPIVQPVTPEQQTPIAQTFTPEQQTPIPQTFTPEQQTPNPQPVTPEPPTPIAQPVTPEQQTPIPQPTEDNSNNNQPETPTPAPPEILLTEKPIDSGNTIDIGKNSLSKAKIVGIVIGVVCGVALAVVLTVFFVIRRNKKATKVLDESNDSFLNDKEVQL